MQFLWVGVFLGVITYLSWMGYYWLYLPPKVRNWFQASTSRLFILDFLLTVVGIFVFAAISATLTAVIAAATIGLLGTITTIILRISYNLRNILKRK